MKLSKILTVFIGLFAFALGSVSANAGPPDHANGKPPEKFYWVDVFGGPTDFTIDEFLEGIETHEHRMAGKSKSGEISMDRIMVKRHLEFREEMETQRDMFHNLKKEFFKFLTKYM